MANRVRALEQRDWDQLVTIAAGFLPLTNGDLEAAMSRAIAAHAGLVEAVRKGRIQADLGRGRVRLFVPDDGGLALAYESKAGASGEVSSELAPDLSLRVRTDEG
ncbi:MAG: hypothetical protein ABMB14_20250 [Myxococcota bacterium]